LLLLAPDYLGFRGALCARHDRRAGLDPAALSLIRGLIPHDPRSDESESFKQDRTDYWLLAARGYAESAKDGTPLDRVLVHDFEIPARIGVY